MNDVCKRIWNRRVCVHVCMRLLMKERQKLYCKVYILCMYLSGALFSLCLTHTHAPHTHARTQAHTLEREIYVVMYVWHLFRHFLQHTYFIYTYIYTYAIRFLYISACPYEKEKDRESGWLYFLITYRRMNVLYFTHSYIKQDVDVIVTVENIYYNWRIEKSIM